MQCWFSRVFYSWRLWLVFSWLCIVLLSHNKTPGITKRSKSSTSLSNPKQPTWPSEKELFEGQGSWILHLLLKTNHLQVRGLTEVLSRMLSTLEQHQGHLHPPQLITIGESLTWMNPIILGQTMIIPRLPTSCSGGPQHPQGAQPKLYAWGRSQKKGKCFYMKNLIQSELSSKKKWKN